MRKISAYVSYAFGFIIALLNSLRLQEGSSGLNVQHIEYGGFN